ncbi:hypothetical protein ACEPAG_2661 [Sanghuangporus baumii]
MRLITHAIAKKLAENNGGSEASEAVATIVDTVAKDKNTAVNADTEGDVSGNRVPANDKELDTEVLQPKIYEVSESNQLAHILLFQKQKLLDGSVVGMQLVRPNHVVLLMPVSLADEVLALATEPSSGNGKSNPQVRNMKILHGTPNNTEVTMRERKRRREETCVTDSQISELTTATRVNARSICRKFIAINETLSHISRFRDTTNSCRKAKIDGGLCMPKQNSPLSHLIRPPNDAAPRLLHADYNDDDGGAGETSAWEPRELEPGDFAFLSSPSYSIYFRRVRHAEFRQNQSKK